MIRKLLDVIVCPKCGGRLKLKSFSTLRKREDERRELSFSEVKCSSVFPIKHGILDLLSNTTPLLENEVNLFDFLAETKSDVPVDFQLRELTYHNKLKTQLAKTITHRVEK